MSPNAHHPPLVAFAQVLASLRVTASLTSGHTVGFAIDSKFPNSSERVYINGFGIMAGEGQERTWKWAGQCIRQRLKGNGERKRTGIHVSPELQKEILGGKMTGELVLSTSPTPAYGREVPAENWRPLPVN